MTHEELRDVVLGHVPPAYQKALLTVIDEHQRLREMAPAPATVTPLSPEEIDRELPGYLAKEGRQ